MDWDEFPELTTERLRLCAITRDHAEWYLRHFSIPEIADGQGFPPPKDLAAAREELERYVVGLYERGEGYRWGIRFKGDEDIIGSIGFYSWDKEHERANMGYDLRPEHWGKGVMTEALERTIRFGFEDMGLSRISVTIMATNPRSMRLIQRAGFVEEGVMREYSIASGRRVDEHVFSMLKRDWRARLEGRVDV
ncbi:MAG: GNAT family N-acetyltransferase [Thermoplasmata archaeon]